MAKRYQNLIEEYCALHSVAVPPGFGRQDAIQLTEGTRNTAHPQAAFVASGFAAGVDCLGLLFFADAAERGEANGCVVIRTQRYRDSLYRPTQ